MYPVTAGPRLAALARSGLLDLGRYAIETFGLEEVNAAVDHAAKHGGPFRMAVVKLRSDCFSRAKLDA